jgi:hypothetical protein
LNAVRRHGECQNFHRSSSVRFPAASLIWPMGDDFRGEAVRGSLRSQERICPRDCPLRSPKLMGRKQFQQLRRQRPGCVSFEEASQRNCKARQQAGDRGNKAQGEHYDDAGRTCEGHGYRRPPYRDSFGSLLRHRLGVRNERSPAILFANRAVTCKRNCEGHVPRRKAKAVLI